MIHEIEPRRMKNEFRPGQRAEGKSPVFVFSEGPEEFLFSGEGSEGRLPRYEELGAGVSPVYLFSIDEDAYFLGSSEGDSLPEGFSFQHFKTLRKQGAKKEFMFAAMTAIHLNRWYRANRFCGKCACPTEHSETERALVCPSCGNTIYPRINPAVIVGVKNGESLLVTKYAGRDIPYYALIAGFTEIGETFEQTVKREVMEEAGLKVKNITYYKSQPWGIADDILSGFYCDVDGDDEIRMDRSELKTAIWAKREEIELQPDEFSLTNEMMSAFKSGRVL
ncbi:MAG: NAD(+) diphosphatase [Lachnospiraceae bacterium]|nr:NAD(+) diphosphatase [Lachnospiraceae bacterium]